ncbi:unnamed protein product [Kuraishia capsulata CBS 1993]|uniref:Selenoprotein O n=1 Tax=Kuraishia capsulata CBS 1993 TaxID=1382522 RepID=W6MP37_9ASCO|nr:uncharacterized protein KUCA_T00004421001 [Kuraishia capsulata CBS 1993]CDK28439.1 unnamed protein product [Kuraishia capsulata CBS 1993]
MQASQRPLVSLSKINSRATQRLAQIHCHTGTKIPMSTSSEPKKSLASLPKTQSFTEKLPADPRVPDVATARDPSLPFDLTHKARRLLSGFYTYVTPEVRKNYKFLLASERALIDLGLDPEVEPLDKDFQRLVTSQDAALEQYPHPYSQCYAGYQFGQFAGQLGDGRVVSLFEVKNEDTGKRYELQLKGSGKTPFSRFADGKAVLRSSIREFIISESLHGIGIPTTRALALSYLPGTYAQRYGAEQCAIVCRMAESWIRIGNFDLLRMRGDRKEAILLADYVLDEVLKGQFKYESSFADSTEVPDGLTKYDKMYLEIVARNAHTVAYWHAYGFLNGVLNTDNTSILGLSIDFGPFAFMDNFNLDYTPNHEDTQLRYSFKNTPNAIWWNLTRLGEDLAELIGAGPELLKDPAFGNEFKKEWEVPVISRAEKVIGFAGSVYEDVFLHEYENLMAKRLGVEKPSHDFHSEVVSPMLDMLSTIKVDYNNFFVDLQKLDFSAPDFDYDSAVSKLTPLDFVSEEIAGLTEETLNRELKSWLPIYRTKLEELNISYRQRHELAASYNPLFLPRNWILDDVIEFTQDSDAEDLRYLRKLLKMSSYPYDATKWGSEDKDLESKWLKPPKGEKSMLQCSCSS